MGTRSEQSLSPLAITALARLRSAQLSRETLKVVEETTAIASLKTAPSQTQLQQLALERLRASTTLVQEFGFARRPMSENWDLANALLAEFISAGRAINTESIQLLHRALVPEHHGSLRSTDLQGGNSLYPPAADLALLWAVFEAEVLDCLSTRHPIVEAAMLYQWLITLHFYSDGNGRTARLVADWRLTQSGLLPLAFANDAASFVSALDEKRQYGPELAVLRICEGLRRAVEVVSGNGF